MNVTGRQFRVDRGGTFTDIVARRPGGRPLTHKLLPDHPARHRDAAVTGLTEPPDLSALLTGEVAAGDPRGVRLYTGGAWRDVLLHRREQLPPGETVTGPAITTEAVATTDLDDGWQAVTSGTGHLPMERVAEPQSSTASTAADPVRAQIAANQKGVDDDLPLNDGCPRPLRTAPHGPTRASPTPRSWSGRCPSSWRSSRTAP
ncbi:hypothetical protein DMA15_05200 [Streptomyces sp. WAC 01529]|nr:hypothetical protein DMA15_05200 [Streptomyces sp. WAC 01529]